MPPKTKRDVLAERMKNYELFLQYLSVWMDHNKDWIIKMAYEQFQRETGLAV